MLKYVKKGILVEQPEIPRQKHEKQKWFTKAPKVAMSKKRV